MSHFAVLVFYFDTFVGLFCGVGALSRLWYFTVTLLYSKALLVTFYILQWVLTVMLPIAYN